MTVVGSNDFTPGLLSDWITGDDVMECCDVETTDGSIFDSAAASAQELLFSLSGRLFPGIGTRTVRPCATTCVCPWQILSRGHIVWNPYDWGYGYWGWGSWWYGDDACGCWPLSRVKLAGYPVQDVTQVKINGAVVDPNTYRLDSRRFLSRVRDPAAPTVRLVWPGCQNLDLEDTEPGTFSVTYDYGQLPPQPGIDAAIQLACELYKACANLPCKLPSGTTRQTRQGTTLERNAFINWAFQPKQTVRSPRGWQTGLSAVDAFLNTSNAAGLIRRPTFWAPSITHRYAPKLG